MQAGGDVTATQKAVGAGAAALTKQMKFDLDAPTRAVKEYTEALDAQLRAQQQNIDVRVQAIGLGDKEASNMEELARVQFEGTEAVRRLTEAHQLNPNEGDEQFAGKLKALQAYWDDYYDATKQGQQRIDAAQSDWHAGVNAAVQNFMDEQRNMYQQAKDFGSSFIGGFSDAFSKFASGTETAKKAFGSFIDSMYQQAMKLLANRAITVLLEGFLGGGVSAYNSMSSSQQVAYDVAHNANGGVYSSPSLSQYSGQIVSNPTTFAFAKGAGVMGEAGPEAILPLSRGSDGKLGVKSGVGASDMQVVINITNNGQQVQARQTGSSMDGKKMMIDLILDTVSGDMVTGGKTARAAQQRFGLQRRGVPVSG